MRLSHLTGFGAYYVYGYYCKRYMAKNDGKRAIYLLGIIAFIVALIGDTYLQLVHFPDDQLFTRYLTPTIFMVSAAIYLFVVNQAGRIHFSPQTTSLITRFSSYTFGAYLLHYMFVWVLPLKLYTLCPIILVPVSALGILALSLLIASILRRIPAIGKLIA